jgi:hypothetical protein
MGPGCLSNLLRTASVAGSVVVCLPIGDEPDQAVRRIRPYVAAHPSALLPPQELVHQALGLIN